MPNQKNKCCISIVLLNVNTSTHPVSTSKMLKNSSSIGIYYCQIRLFSKREKQNALKSPKDRKTEKQKEGQAERQTDRKTVRQRDRKTQKDRMKWQKNRKIHWRNAERRRDRETDRKRYRKINMHCNTFRWRAHGWHVSVVRGWGGGTQGKELKLCECLIFINRCLQS